jgi:acyl dehydratase
MRSTMKSQPGSFSRRQGDRRRLHVRVGMLGTKINQVSVRSWSTTIHYDVEYARRHGHIAPVVHGLQVFAFTAPGATLFPQYIGEVFVAFTSASCKFLKEVHSGDTLYPALEIIALTPQGDAGIVTTRATVHNQRGELVLEGEHQYALKTSSKAAK